MARTIDQLVEAAQHGDSGATQELYERFRPLVVSLMRRYRHLQVADDLPGEVYLAFVRLLREFDPGRGVHFPYYVARTLRAAVYTYVRKECLANSREIPGSQVPHDPFDAADQRAPYTHVADTVVSNAMLDDLLRHLSERQAYIFVNRGLRAREYDEIAGALQTSLGAVRWQYHTARRRLEEKWRASLDDEA